MNYFKNQICDFKDPVVTMGTFDGVHLGHRHLIGIIKSKAQQKNRKSVAISYYHHPLETIHKKTFPYLLTERKYKENLLKQMGIDCVIYLDFNQEMANMSADEFLKKIIINEVGPSEIVIGYDTHFGKNREGDFKFLEENAEKYHYLITAIEPYRIKNKIISSSRIRDFIREGDMEQANLFLGRFYSVTGIIRSGDKIGRKIGFPTINIEPIDAFQLEPSVGVYICKVAVDGCEYTGVTNIGYSPTLKKTGVKEIETHILDFDGDLYRKEVEIKFVKRLRDELYYKNKADLIDQIQLDIEQTRSYFDEDKTE